MLVSSKSQIVSSSFCAVSRISSTTSTTELLCTWINVSTIVYTSTASDTAAKTTLAASTALAYVFPSNGETVDAASSLELAIVLDIEAIFFTLC